MNYKNTQSVSAVIPTRNRAQLVARAVRSALQQDSPVLEVIVVIDGPDEETQDVLNTISDPRLSLICLKESVGGAGARNVGIRAAQGDWIAFLDDDDEWLPEKIRKQLEVAANADCVFPIVSCRMYARTPYGQHVWPRRLPSEGEAVSEYIMARRSLFQGEGTITTTTLLVPKELLMRVPFADGQQRHQEWDWLFRAMQSPDAKVVFASDPLSVWYIDENRATVSDGKNWRYSFEWIERMRPLVTPRAYAAFLLTLVTSIAARAGDWRAYVVILRQAIRHGRPAPIDYLLFCGMVAVPQEYRRRIRALLAG